MRILMLFRTSVLARISEYIMQETMKAQRSFFTIITIGNASHGNSSNWKIMRTCLKIFIRKKPSNRQPPPEPGVNLWQQTLGGSHFQYWEFIKQPNETYLIRLKDSELYLTITSDENNSDIIFMPKQDSDNQRWKLIRQNPII